MFVQQLEFDHVAKVCLNEGGLNDVGDMSVAELRQAAEEQFGSIAGTVQDPDDESRTIGWKFQAEAKYDELPEEEDNSFTLETWVVLHSKQPVVRYFYAELGTESVSPAIVTTEVDNS